MPYLYSFAVVHICYFVICASGDIRKVHSYNLVSVCGADRKDFQYTFKGFLNVYFYMHTEIFIGRVAAGIPILAEENVEEVLADKIEIVLPKDKYGQLKVYKVSGNLSVIDKENCFEELSICGNVGDINCYTSAKSVYANTQAGDIYLEYVALQEGKIDLWNTLGEVKVATSFVKKIAGELFSQKGTVRNIHKQSVNYFSEESE